MMKFYRLLWKYHDGIIIWSYLYVRAYLYMMTESISKDTK